MIALLKNKVIALFHAEMFTTLTLSLTQTDLKSQGSKLAQLDMAKADAVMAEDYDLAKEIKDESDLLRRQIEEQVRNLYEPSVYLYVRFFVAFLCAKILAVIAEFSAPIVYV